MLLQRPLWPTLKAFDEAVGFAKSQPQLRVGCHVVLIDGEPLISGLESLAGKTGKFKSSLKEFALAAVRKTPFARRDSARNRGTTLHGTDITIVGADRSYLPVTRYAIEMSDGVTAISNYLKKRTVQEFEIPNPIEVIYNFVNCCATMNITLYYKNNFCLET